MADRAGAGVAALWERRGVAPLPPDRGLRLLERLLAAGGLAPAQVLAVSAAWARAAPAGTAPPLLADLLPAPGGERAGDEALLRSLRQAGPDGRLALLREHVRAEVVRVLGLEHDRPIDDRQKFFDLGMDSLMAVELKGRLESSLALALPASLPFDYPTPGSLARYLADELRHDGEATAPEGSAPAPAGAAGLEGLSEAELDSIVKAELEKLLKG
jgi:acyl carrier protein